LIAALRILVVDDDRRMARTLVDIFRVNGHEAEAAHSGPEALEMLKQRPFDCVLTDIKMPEMNGVEFYQAVQVSQPDLPIVLMTAYPVDDLVKEGLKGGVIATLTKPLDIDLLLGFFSALRKERSIVIIDDDLKFAQTLGDILRKRGFTVTQIHDPHTVMERLEANSQVVLLDMKLNNISGLDLLRKIREQCPHLPVILVTGYCVEMAGAIEAALEINAYTCLCKPFEIEELLELLEEIRHRELQKALGQTAKKGTQEHR